MDFLFRGSLARCIWAATLGMLVMCSAQAGSDGGSAVDFTRSFLEKYPRFRAEGVMTSTLPGRPPYRCRVEMVFDKKDSVLFTYNTDGAKNIIPYDFDYQDKRLKETIYNRDRTQVVKTTDVGAPTRTIFNFVWDILREAEQGVGFNSLLFNGLMSINREDAGKGTRITLNRRIPAIPVEKVRFTFDSEDRLKGIEISQGDGSTHRIDIRRFRPNPDDDDGKPESKVESKPEKAAPPRH